MNKEKIIHLLKAYQQQTATPQEKAEFTAILHDKRYDPIFSEVLDQHWDELKSEEIAQVTFPTYDRLLQEIKKQPQIAVSTIKWWPRIIIAAATILIVFSVGAYYFGNITTNDKTEYFANDINPGKNGATLTLANGKKILISEALAGHIADESGVKITKTKDGLIMYEVVGTPNAALSYNTLATTRGEQTQVRLPDGTIVFLNAESSLKFPTCFTKTNKRKVSLTGEAYFQVTKDKQHPFVVATDQQQVEVLGTTFNINSYTDEPTVKTTLLEGSVRITNLSSSGSGLLKPGEQSIISNKELNIKKVEVDDVVAWKNGYFMFNNETLESIMKKVSRWYDVEVLYQDASMKRKTFFGSVSRFDKISELLSLLQKTEGVAFQVKGKQIIVSQK